MKYTVLATFVVILCVVAMVLLPGKALGHEPTDDDVVEQLRLAGSNLTKPHPIDFYIYVPYKPGAERIAKLLTDRNFQVKISPPNVDSRWQVLASKFLVPTSQALAKLRHELTELAKGESGEYDGWEAAVTK